VDAIDDEILSQLRVDGRVSFSELGRRVGLSTNAAAARVRKLEATGVIVGYRAILAADAPAAEALEAYIDVRLAPDAQSTEFLHWARAQPAVRDAVHVTGPYDYLLHVTARDTRQLDQVLRQLKSDGRAAQTLTRLALRTD